MGILFVPNGMLRGAGDMGAFTFSSMANLFSRVAIAYALAYLTPLGAKTLTRSPSRLSAASYRNVLTPGCSCIFMSLSGDR